MSDQTIPCAECGNTFVFSDAEREFYESKGLATPPKRCKECRKARKAQAGGDRGPRPNGGGGGDRGWAPRPPREGGNRFPGGPGGERRGPPPARGGFGNDRGSPPRGGFGGDRSGPPRDNRAPRSFDGPPRNGGFDRGPSPRGDRGPAPQQGDRGPRPPRAQWGSRPARDEQQPAAPKAETPRRERPRFDITCHTCGVAAQVPFKPLEGRQVFCQPCYRARKGVEQPTTDEATLTEPDTGIVE